MATITVQTIGRSGLEPAFAAASAGGDQFANDGHSYMEIINGDGTDTTVTIATQKTVDGKAVGDDAIVVTAGERRKIGPFPPSIYNDVNGRVQVTYSKVTSLTGGVFRLR